jgi:hypothetical protein
MPSLRAMLAKDPLPMKPFNAIKFVRFDSSRTAPYNEGKSKEGVGCCCRSQGRFSGVGWSLPPLQELDAAPAALARL